MLAKDAKTGRLIEMEEVEREKGRKAVHKGDVKFTEWLEERGGVPDTGECAALPSNWTIYWIRHI